MTTQINQLTELTSTSDGDLLLIRDNATGVDKKMQASNLRAKATTKDDVGLGDVDNVSAADLRDRSTHTGTQTLSTISDAGTIASQDANSVNIDGGTIDGTAVNATNLAYTGTLTGGTGVVNLGSGQVVKDANGRLLVGTTSAESVLNKTIELHSAGTGLSQPSYNVFSYNAAAGNTGYFEFNRSRGLSVGSNVLVQSGDRLGMVRFSGANGTSYNAAAEIICDVDGVPSATNDMPGRLVFATTADGSGSSTERMRIDSSGNVLVGKTSLSDATDGISLRTQGIRSVDVTATTNQTRLAMFRRENHDGSCIDFNRGANKVGSIDVDASSTSYVTSSDYRLKENIQPLTGALDKVQTMNPVTYDWKAGGEGEGFIAHELQDIAPYAVSGEKDGEDMQGVDYGKLTTLLVGAVKELTAKVEQLEAQLGANNGN